jgi:hypothetical protein
VKFNLEQYEIGTEQKKIEQSGEREKFNLAHA